MNIYVVIEGERGAKKVYQEWIQYLNPRLRYVNSIDAINANSFFVIAGYGYPFYFDVIEGAVEDVNNHGGFDRLVIAVDSEDFTHQEKFDEISSFVAPLGCTTDIHIVVQHFCFETWALGNRVIVRRNPQSAKLRFYLRTFNVITDDPELLPPLPSEGLNRSQLAANYLRIALNTRYKELTYNKNNPQPLLHKRYFQRVKDRYEQTGHISSFRSFLTAFI